MKTTIQRKLPTMGMRAATFQDVKSIDMSNPSDLDTPILTEVSSHVISVGTQDVAFVSYVRRDTELFITQLYVFPNVRGYGIGRQVLELLASFKNVEIVHAVSTLSSLAFFEKCGFEQGLGQLVVTKVV